MQGRSPNSQGAYQAESHEGVGCRQCSTTTSNGSPEKVRGPKNALQYCVRLSDGYYFPTPNSQYKQKAVRMPLSFNAR
ncbi:DUF2865 domain-containing protein (plasmid) [Ochrobactrum pseudogrignonense]|uniref:DUF2865 domain-containing protein n=1 Tax=Brucella pseudogrignonensis TaxID=419475 RepID=A0A7Y3WYT9_9HYPH|nr:DUF2865 domain-containing protein [Brucella pseudogrignonensis]